MNETSLALLDYQALKDLVGRHLSGPLGRQHLDRVAPSADRSRLEEQLAETAEAVVYLREQTRPPLAGFQDCTASAQKLGIEGSVLEAQEIVDLLAFLAVAGELRHSLTGEPERFARLARRASQLADFRPIVRDFSGKILPNGQVADEASVALARIRRDIDKQQKAIQTALDRFLRAHRGDGLLQDEYITIRRDRYVVPVVAGQRGRTAGVVHGSSSSGQTMFLEPLETIELNNHLGQLVEEEQREVHRILRELTARLREHAEAIGHALAITGSFDLLFAKAGFARAFDCVIPKFSPETQPRLSLTNARHPLLEDILKRQGERVVPVTLELEHKRRTLLISGPNAGGKTVAMKTVGLLALMAQSAFPVPADFAELPLFDQVLADIGDHQSMEQSLSTFSAHVAAVREMLDEATPESLLLLDELGRATDPEEGGALGVAVMEHFSRLGSVVLASTHLLPLKAWGASHETVLSASMGFDAATLRATYVLRVGAPGKSAGLDIATRLGLPAQLIDRARGAMSTAERDLAAFLNELHQRLDSLRAREAAMEQQQRELAAREAALETQFQRREAARIRELDQRFEALVRQFEEQSKETLESIRDASQRKAAEHGARKVAKVKREFSEQLSQVLTPESKAAAASAAEPARPAIAEGSRVVLKGVRQPARVRRLLSNGMIEVDAGFLKMQVSPDDVQEVLADGPDSGPKLPANVSLKAGPRWDVPYSEINVIGKRAEEAVDEIDRFLDHAALASVMRVRIVHGHGMGVLKRAVSELLAQSPHVEKFYPASPSEGGSGATIAELKGA